MFAPDVLARIQAAGIHLKPLPDGRLWVEPRSRLTDELRSLLVEHKAELLAALRDGDVEAANDAAVDSGVGARQRLLEMLRQHPKKNYAVIVDAESDPDATILALAIRGKATAEFRIPKQYDPFLLMDLIDKCGTELLT